MSKIIKSRSYCFTLFCEGTTKCASAAFELKGNMRYIVWQQEVCPDTLKEHYQGYVELTTPMRLKAVKDLLGYSKLHLEPRMGTRDEARGYCLKAETKLAGPWELGSWDSGGSGKRNDLDEAAKTIREEGLNAVADANPGQFIRLQKHFRDYECYIDSRFMPPERQVLCYWIHGPSDIGKTHCIFHSVSDLFSMTPGKGQDWFDGYNREQGLLIDDLLPEGIPASSILHIADKWRYRLPIKGAFTYARWNLVVVTSMHTIHYIYQGCGNIQSIIRRFKIIEVKTRADCTAAATLIQREMVEDTERRLGQPTGTGGQGGLGNTVLDHVPPDSPPRLRRAVADF